MFYCYLDFTVIFICITQYSCEKALCCPGKESFHLDRRTKVIMEKIHYALMQGKCGFGFFTKIQCDRQKEFHVLFPKDQSR